MSNTLEQPSIDTSQPDAPRHRDNRPLKVALFVVALIAIGLGVLLVYSVTTGGDSGDPGATVPAAVQQVIDDYNTAITAKDMDAWRATLTDDFSNHRNVYFAGSQEFWEDESVVEDANSYAYRIEFYPDISYEQIGEPLVSGDGPWFATFVQRWEITEEDLVFDGNGTLTVVERDGEMKVASEFWVGTLTIDED